jgi:hypothetical protein
LAFPRAHARVPATLDPARLGTVGRFSFVVRL